MVVNEKSEAGNPNTLQYLFSGNQLVNNAASQAANWDTPQVQ
ncbi:MAG: hypothetical protein RIS73_444 [Bacteroidota bacterium]|jgi:hypothetical protein